MTSIPQPNTIFAVAFAGLVLSASPGPSMLYVLSHSVGHSRMAGLASALGLAMGGVILAIATALGLAALFDRFDWLVVALRYIGSGYLIWIGVSMIRNARADAQTTFTTHHVQRKSFLTIVWQGALVELLNPKTVLFFALFLPPFVTAGGEHLDSASIQFQLLFLGILVPLTAIPSDMLVAFMGGAMTQSINKNRAFRETFAWFGGLVLVGIALNLHLQFLG